MRALTAQAIVEAWGRGKNASLAQRPLALLSVAMPEARTAELVDLSLGQRDAMLLRLRGKTFGPFLKSYVRCGQCQATLNFELDVDEILAGGATEELALTTALSTDGYEVRFRPPSGRDLARAAALDSIEAGHDLLLECCVTRVERDGVEVAASDLPAPVVEALCERILEVDPLVEIPVELNCSLCGEDSSVLLDIGTFFWEEVAATAQKLMYKVYTLARGYGWSESEVLAMGAARRQYYLELVTR